VCEAGEMIRVTIRYSKVENRVHIAGNHNSLSSTWSYFYVGKDVHRSSSITSHGYTLSGRFNKLRVRRVGL
jgi:hypothetical protein